MEQNLISQLDRIAPGFVLVQKKESPFLVRFKLKNQSMTPPQALKVVKWAPFYLGSDFIARITGEPQTVEVVQKKPRQAVSWQPLQGGNPLEIILGQDDEGNSSRVDLARLPHLLIAGSTGSGKSVVLNSLICSLIQKNQPEDLRLVLVDPKRVEFAAYKNLKNLFCPIIRAEMALTLFDFLVEEMEVRYKILEKNNVKNISELNALEGLKLPFLVVVVDEYADLKWSAPKELETKICSLAQKARAAGIHLILATQRPSADVLTGTIKANFPARLALRCASSVDSRTILGGSGAEALEVGEGLLSISGDVKKVYLPFISDKQIEEVISCDAN